MVAHIFVSPVLREKGYDISDVEDWHPIWIRAGYYLLGFRVPSKWIDWVSSDIGRPAWHKWVPRLRITVVLVAAIVAFAGPWTPLWPVVTTLLIATVLLIWVGRTGDGDEARKRELMFQNRVVGWDSRLGMFMSPLSMAAATSGDYENLNQTAHDNHTAEPIELDGVGIQTKCKWCSETIQLEGDVWHHRDPEWVLFECPECGWQDVESMACPACGRQKLLKTTIDQPNPPTLKRLLYLLYVLAFVGLAVWLIVNRILQP